MMGVQKKWFIEGAKARSFMCGCVSCRKQFRRALEESELFDDEEIEEAMKQHWT